MTTAKRPPKTTYKPFSKAKAKGRPTLYQRKLAEQAKRLALLGQIDAEMADFFGVSESTFNMWKQRHAEFSESIREGKEVADALVAESLFNAATGAGTITEVREQTAADGGITRTVEKKQLPSSVSAMIFWLKNRQREKWRDKIEHSADVTVAGFDGEALCKIYDERMAIARARQAAVLEERGMVEAEPE
jgi:hypothetical protein